MRTRIVVIACTLVGLLAGCIEPPLLSCARDQLACSDGCVDVMSSATNCGACGNSCGSGATCTAGMCVPASSLCAVANGGCAPDADCIDMGGTIACACHAGFTGDGFSCAACTVCPASDYMATPCSPANDTVCAACSTCGTGSFEAAPCGPTQDTTCVPCPAGCTACTSSACTDCEPGFQLVNGMCVMGVCGNGVIEPGEQCDDGNPTDGDGCSSTCLVEAGSYCFGEVISQCRAGSCDFEPGVLPLGPAFAIDGNAIAGSMGLHFTQRSTLYTTSDVAYPMMIEADVVYSGADTTYLGARGNGLRDATANDEPTDSLRARLSASATELVAGTTTVNSVATPFVPTQGVPYHVRYVDDGNIATISWIDMTNPMNGVELTQDSTFHGSADRAFIGGGDQGGLDVANVRVCSAPLNPVSTGLVASYSAIPSWTAIQDGVGNVSSWLDVSGNGNTLSVNGTSPVYMRGLFHSLPVLDFSGGARLSTAAFPLTTDVTVFIVAQHRTPAQWGALAHHGNRDTDWSMEQSGDADSNVLHWQTNNDNVNADLTLVADTDYVLTGRFAGTARYFSATTFDASAPLETSIVDASHTITTGDKVMFVGASDNNEASNAYIASIVYYNRALSDAERDSVIGYLRALWQH